MAWGPKRDRISHTEAHELGLTHVRPSDHVTASASRKSIVVEGPGYPTGFTQAKSAPGGWKVHTYDPYMAGHFQRRPAAEATPYADYLQNTRQATFHDRRSNPVTRETRDPRIQASLDRAQAKKGQR